MTARAKGQNGDNTPPAARDWPSFCDVSGTGETVWGVEWRNRRVISGRLVQDPREGSGMPRVLDYVWECVKCGHRWYAAEKPVRCASCKARTWNGPERQEDPIREEW